MTLICAFLYPNCRGAINSEQPPALSDRISWKIPPPLVRRLGAPRTSEEAGSVFTRILTHFQKETTSADPRPTCETPAHLQNGQRLVASVAIAMPKGFPPDRYV